MLPRRIRQPEAGIIPPYPGDGGGGGGSGGPVCPVKLAVLPGRG